MNAGAQQSMRAASSAAAASEVAFLYAVPYLIVSSLTNKFISDDWYNNIVML